MEKRWGKEILSHCIHNPHATVMLLSPYCMSLHVYVQSESLSSEKKFLLGRVSQLSSELEDAHRTIAAMENINVSIVPSTGHPCTLQHTVDNNR